ncbi:3-phosphoshikimate 1-carboxyvinyltransferase [Candidatus Peregrinibacteria bacterium]|nr:3-phosphoshikimate 1-carboxyvinyltransferase [Candidatus Peregrinibacteria bacterium]
MRSIARSMAPLRLPFDATLTMPGSKSHANRAIIAACLSSGNTTIRNATVCDDVDHLVHNLQTTGFALHYKDRKKGILLIRGRLPVLRKKKPVELFCGNAGTTTRFLTALACVVPGSFIITGDSAMRNRPIHDLVEALGLLGADIQDTNGCPPVFVGRRTIRGGSISLKSHKSSQYLSALLLIAPALSGGLSLHVSGSLPSRSYVDLTKHVMRDFGVTVRERKGAFSVSKHASYRSPRLYDIVGDHSAAGAFLVLAELTRSSARFSNLHQHSDQGDAVLPRVITRMRKGGTITIDCSDFPDQVMNLAMLAAFRGGQTLFTGISNLRHKECDRLAVLTRELRRAGITIREQGDDLIVRGIARLTPALLDPHHDHRMAFCFAILGSVHAGIRIKHSQCVSKSYPRFFEDLQILHHSSKPIAIIGMRGVGKSTFGKKLASSLRLKHIDTDSVFERKHGSIRSYFQRKRLVEFRREEERIVAECLKPHCVVSLGGGAIESPATRKILKERAVVISLQARSSSILQRLKRDRRPPLTPLPLVKEVPLIMKRRRPLEESVAHISLREPHDLRFAIHSLRALCSR